MRTFSTPGELVAAAGSRLGASRYQTVLQHDVDVFAALTGDRQWIHIDPVRARSGPFGGPIAHGMYTLSLVVPLLTEVFTVDGAALVLNKGFDRVRFAAPVPVGARVRLVADLRSAVARVRGLHRGRGGDRHRGRRTGLAGVHRGRAAAVPGGGGARMGSATRVLIIANPAAGSVTPALVWELVRLCRRRARTGVGALDGRRPVTRSGSRPPPRSPVWTLRSSSRSAGTARSARSRPGSRPRGRAARRRRC